MLQRCCAVNAPIEDTEKVQDVLAKMGVDYVGRVKSTHFVDDGATSVITFVCGDRFTEHGFRIAFGHLFLQTFGSYPWIVTSTFNDKEN